MRSADWLVSEIQTLLQSAVESEVQAFKAMSIDIV